MNETEGVARKARARVLAAAMFAVAWFGYQPDARAQLDGANRGEGGYFRFGVAAAATQDVANRGAVPLPGIAGIGGLGLFLNRDVALELNIDVTTGWDVGSGDEAPAVVLSGAHGAVRYYPDPRDGLFALGGIGFVGEGPPGDAGFGGAGGVLAVGYDFLDSGFGFTAYYTQNANLTAATSALVLPR